MRRPLVIATAAGAIAVFVAAFFIYDRNRNTSVDTTAGTALIREHSPVIGPANARVTIVEFFDPACEVCRAFYPFVKDILAQYPDDIRLVLRYTAFHQGSDEAIRILEAARRQNLFLPVLEALLNRQEEWANDRAPNTPFAWNIAATTGLDTVRARADAISPEVSAIVRQDGEDVRTVGIQGTPTFFINGGQLTALNPAALAASVTAAVDATR